MVNYYAQGVEHEYDMCMVEDSVYFSIGMIF